jgi:hypothetical protein
MTTAHITYARTVIDAAEKALGHTLSDGQRRDLLRDQSALSSEEIIAAVAALHTPEQHEREVCLSVPDYSGDFDLCAQSIHDAEMVFRGEAKEAKVTVTRVVAVVFDEFDSNNPSHAGAYFVVTYEGDTWPDDDMATRGP